MLFKVLDVRAFNEVLHWEVSATEKAPHSQPAPWTTTGLQDETAQPTRRGRAVVPTVWREAASASHKAALGAGASLCVDGPPGDKVKRHPCSTIASTSLNSMG